MVLPVSGQSGPYAYGKKITILASEVAGTTDLTDFPLLVSFTDPDLRTVGNGGYVQHNSGFDILFSLEGYDNPLDYEIERYVRSTGQLVAWVRIPTLSATVDTDLYMYFGSPTATTNPNSLATFAGEYLGVYHFSGSGNDASGNARHLTRYGGANVGSAKIGRGRDLNNNPNVLSQNTGAYFAAPTNLLAGVSNFTFSGWVYLDRADTNWERIFDFGQSETTNFFFSPTTATGSPSGANVRITTNGNGTEQGISVNHPSAITGRWIHWTVTLDDGNNTMRLYRNGALYSTATGVTLRPWNMEGSSQHYFGRSQYDADHYIDAKFDEFRLASTTKSPSWIATEYANQDTPSDFYTVGPRIIGSSLNAMLPVELLSFSALADPSGAVLLNWSTASESENDYFTVERTLHATDWEAVLMLRGQGISLQPNEYEAVDRHPLPGLSYYRLKQTDFDGQFAYSEVRSVHNGPLPAGGSIFPNPFSNRFTLSGETITSAEVALQNGSGTDLTPTALIIQQAADVLAIDLTGFPTGVYFLRTPLGLHRVVKQ